MIAHLDHFWVLLSQAFLRQTFWYVCLHTCRSFSRYIYLGMECWGHRLSASFINIFFKYIYFLERGERREKERERKINVWLPLVCPQLGTWPTTQACALTGKGTGDPLVPRPELNPLSHTSQGKCIFNYLVPNSSPKSWYWFPFSQ